MSHLYWSTNEDNVLAALQSLHDLGRDAKVEGAANGWPLLFIPKPDDALLALTAKLIQQQVVIGAALTAEPLGPEQYFIAAEWRRCLVVEKSEVSSLARAEAWFVHKTDYEPLGLLIFDVLGDGGAATGAFGLLNAIPRSAHIVMADPAAFYGRFAAADVGGANALFAAGLEAARHRGLADGTVLVGGPEALGFGVDDGEASVSHWRQKGMITVEAHGCSLERITSVIDGLESFSSAAFNRDTLAEELSTWRGAGLSFGLAIVLRGIDDPPVVIPMGAVYQQPIMGSQSQTLAVAKPATAMVGLGATVPLVLPAWCLNPTFSAPSGPMAPTPLVAAEVAGSQDDVWRGVRQRYGGRA